MARKNVPILNIEHLSKKQLTELKKIFSKLHPQQAHVMTQMCFRKLSAKDVATMWGVTTKRIYQIIRSGKSRVARHGYKIEWIKDIFPPEIWVDSMVDFRCKKCGNCCLNLTDAFQGTVYQEDIDLWEKEGRYDILKWVDNGDIWINPKTGEDVDRCPWLRKRNNMPTYYCRIHNVKPKVCREYPKTVTLAKKTNCIAFKREED